MGVAAGENLPTGQYIAEPVIDQPAIRIVGRNEEKDGRSRGGPLQDPLGEALKLTPLCALPLGDGGEGGEWTKRRENRPHSTSQKQGERAGGDDRSGAHLDPV